MVWRRLRIAGNTSLASLHYIIQISQRWEDDHLHCFHIYGKDYGISKDGGMGFPDNPYQVTIDILRIIVTKDEQTTTVIGEICRRIEALDEMRFNHKKVDKALSRLDLDNPTVEESFIVFG